MVILDPGSGSLANTVALPGALALALLIAYERDPSERGCVVVQVLSAQFRTYIGQLEKLQLDIVSKNDLIGVDDSRIANIFSRKTNELKNRSAVFALGDRANVLKVR